MRPDADATVFLDAVRAWLEENNDPRLVRFPDGGGKIEDLAGACADFCRYMADQARKAEAEAQGRPFLGRLKWRVLGL